MAAMPVARVIDGKPFAFVQGTHFVESDGHIALYRVDLAHERTSLESASSTPPPPNGP
jgi:hypothetical protein